MKIINMCAFASAAVGLAACGGGSTSDAPEQSYGGLTNAFLTPAADHLAGDATFLQAATPLSQVPTSDSATYQGQIGILILGDAPLPSDFSNLDQISAPDLIGNVEITADFSGSGGSFSGSADGFFDQSSFAREGTLVISGGSIDRDNIVDETSFTAVMSGNLNIGGTTELLSGDVNASLRGEGDLVGIVESDGSSTENFVAGFVAFD